ncbi:MAG TPA: MFS transporter [Candidatus Binatia bacterium]|nr:MFS transporter [Candidatus Binatia bacterium]
MVRSRPSWRLAPAPRRLLDGFSPDVRRALTIDVAAAVLGVLFTALTGPFHGLYLRRELGATPLVFSLLASANAGCLLLSVVLSRAVSGCHPLTAVVWCAVLARGLYLLVPLIASPWPFVGILVGGTLLGAVGGPAQAALVQQVYRREERGRALAVVRVAAAGFGIALALAAGHLVAALGYRVVFAGAGLFGVAAALVLRRLPVPPAPPAEASRVSRAGAAWTIVREDVAYRRLLLASFVFGGGIWLMMPATPLLLADVLQVTTAQVSTLAAVAAATGIAGNLLWGRLADRHSSLTTLRAVYLVGALTPLAYYAAASPWMLVAATLTESLMATGLDLVWMLVVIDFAGPRRAASYAAIAATLAGVRGVLAPLVGGILIQTAGLSAVYLAAAALMGLGALLVSQQIRQIRQQAPFAAAQCVRIGLTRLRHAHLAR